EVAVIDVAVVEIHVSFGQRLFVLLAGTELSTELGSSFLVGWLAALGKVRCVKTSRYHRNDNFAFQLRVDGRPKNNVGIRISRGGDGFGRRINFVHRQI